MLLTLHNCRQKVGSTLLLWCRHLRVSLKTEYVVKVQLELLNFLLENEILLFIGGVFDNVLLISLLVFVVGLFLTLFFVSWLLFFVRFFGLTIVLSLALVIVLTCGDARCESRIT